MRLSVLASACETSYPIGHAADQDVCGECIRRQRLVPNSLPIVPRQALILGVVLAGGKSSRFGSDKALAELGGHSLLARAVDTLSGWCEYVVVAGRATAPAPTLPDWPAPGMGPLGGLAAALHLARDEGYEAVLSLGVDSLGLPDNLPDWLGAQARPIAASYIASQPVIGLWPANTVNAIEAILTGGSNHSLRALAKATGAKPVTLPSPPDNINTLADLAAMEREK